MSKLLSLLLVIMMMTFYPNEVRAQAPSDAEGVIAATDHSEGSPLAQQALAQQQQGNVPQAAKEAEAEVKRAARRFNLGVQGGVGLDPEIVDVGVHGSFGPIFDENLAFRPVLEIGAGEITTLLTINLDVLYTFASTTTTRWTPYFGAGPQFGLAHQSIDAEDALNLGVELPPDQQDRFDFGDTDFNGGMNFIVGMKTQKGAFFEMKATAWGVTTIRLLAGFNFFGRGASQ